MKRPRRWYTQEDLEACSTDLLLGVVICIAIFLFCISK